MAPTKIRLGTASPGTQTTTPETLAQLEHIARRAAEKNIDILLLPEAYVGGYPRGTHFGCVIGARTKEGRDEYLRYFQNAVDLGDTVGDGGAGAGGAWVRRELGGHHDGGGFVSDGPGRSQASNDGEVAAAAPPKRGDGTREQLERIAKETGVFLVVGCIEKAGGSMYCSAVYVCPRLGMVGKRRKVMPTGTERLVWAQGAPATLRAVSTTIRGVRINMAAAICWENYMPLVRQALYSQNINLYLAPTADGRDTWLSLMRTVGIEGRCFVVSSNMCVPEPKPTPPGSKPPAVATATHEPVFADDKQQHSSEDESTTTAETREDEPDPQPICRRTSCVTEEGFEIALPSPTTHSHSHSHHHPRQSLKATATRRKSVFDEDGNEIVLCCKEEDDGGVDGEEDTSSPTTTTTTTSPVRTWARATAAAKARSHVPKPVNNGHHANNTFASASGAPAKFISRGGSSIVSPFGEVVAGPQWEDDVGIIYADVDFENCIRGRLDLDAAGSYSRNDSFKFSVQGLDLSPLPY